MRIYRKLWKSVFKNFRKMKKVRKMYIPERNMFLLKGTFWISDFISFQLLNLISDKVKYIALKLFSDHLYCRKIQNTYNMLNNYKNKQKNNTINAIGKCKLHSYLYSLLSYRTIIIDTPFSQLKKQRLLRKKDTVQQKQMS